MPSTLVFPDGVRLALRNEIPGSDSERDALWARLESANIAQGFTIKPSNDARFSHYAEINVDAPHIWDVFRDLCRVVLGPTATLVAGESDATPTSRGSGEVTSLIAILEPHKYQLAHDGFLQFGLSDDDGGGINEVFLAPTKHFQVCLNDEQQFRRVMQTYGLREHERLQFLDEYPHMTVRLSEDHEPQELLEHFAHEIGASARVSGKPPH